MFLGASRGLQEFFHPGYSIPELLLHLKLPLVSPAALQNLIHAWGPVIQTLMPEISLVQLQISGKYDLRQILALEATLHDNAYPYNVSESLYIADVTHWVNV